MKLSIKSIIPLLLLIAVNSYAKPKEGEQYINLTTPITDKTFPAVTEFFSLACSHCRQMETYLPLISEHLGTPINKIHVTSNQSSINMALLYYAAEMQFNRVPDHDFMEQLFSAVGIPEPTQRQLAIEKTFRDRNLVSPYQFNEQQNQQLIDKVGAVRTLSEQLEINSVPTFVIKGRYLLLTRGHSSIKDITETISYLLKK